VHVPDKQAAAESMTAESAEESITQAAMSLATIAWSALHF